MGISTAIAILIIGIFGAILINKYSEGILLIAFASFLTIILYSTEYKKISNNLNSELSLSEKNKHQWECDEKNSEISFLEKKEYPMNKYIDYKEKCINGKLFFTCKELGSKIPALEEDGKQRDCTTDGKELKLRIYQTMIVEPKITMSEKKYCIDGYLVEFKGSLFRQDYKYIFDSDGIPTLCPEQDDEIKRPVKEEKKFRWRYK